MRPAKKSVKLALRAALEYQDDHISPSYLLLGILDQRDNAAVRVLANAGIDKSALREQVARRMQPPD